MANKLRSDIYQKIVEILKTNSYTTLQIAKQTNINWETAKNALHTLSNINLVSSFEKNKKKYFTINPVDFLQLRKDTLLGLPLTKEQETKTKTILKSIEEVWKNMFQIPLKKTLRQKILIKLIKQENIKNIPYGWYLFGQCAVLHSPELENIIPTNKYDIKIKKIITEYKDLSTTDLLHHHYREENNELYLNKIKINDLLLNPFTEESLTQLKRTILHFICSFKKADKDPIDSVNAFHSYLSRLIKHKNLKELEEIRPLINETFNIVWDLMATYNLYHSLKQWYEEPILKKYYELKKETLIPVIKEYLDTLLDYAPIIISDEFLRKFKGILANKSQ